ncbi:hypothetical protein CCHR01_00069 [Colletotrichum chrysophilum]|uniref:Uncharacterized protein n=1 Tax=Colletotrichum chrysophilum TaxID=1836956 RepID=A0AAD9AZ04_9PEZI|nr:hypothetical protein CCHR01_00069 [Colletotrichum chrysophilum]
MTRRPSGLAINTMEPRNGSWPVGSTDSSAILSTPLLRGDEEFTLRRRTGPAVSFQAVDRFHQPRTTATMSMRLASIPPPAFTGNGSLCRSGARGMATRGRL